MDVVDQSEDSGPERRADSTFRVVRMALLSLFSAIIWSFAVWSTYKPTGLWRGHVTVPNARRLVADFDLRVDPVSRVLLDQGGLILPFLACAGLALAWSMRSRWAWGFVLVALPVVVVAAQYSIGVYYTSRLVDALNA